MRKASGILCIVTATLALCVACTLGKPQAPPLTGPSELAQSMSIRATPDSISQDGGSQSSIVITVLDPTGKGISGLTLRLDMEVNGVAQDFGTLSARTVVTDSNGRATAVYTAPPAPPASLGGSGTIVQIVATITGTNFIAAQSQNVQIRLVPPGVILPPAGTPTANFTFSPTSPTANIPILFDGSSSLVGSGATRITSFSWTFGDGTSGTGQTVSKTFTSAGTFNVTLTVTNDRGLAGSTTKTVTVGAGTPPTASFVFSPKPVTVGVRVFFDASGSTAGPGHTIVQYRWNWGDGDPIAVRSGPTEDHDYTAPGTYTVTLTVVDEAGQTGTKSDTVDVTSGNPTAKLTLTKAGPAVIADGNQSTAVGSATIVNYRFSWGDFTPDTSGSSATAAHTYVLPGTYTVTLTVTDSVGRFGVTTATVTIP